MILRRVLATLALSAALSACANQGPLPTDLGLAAAEMDLLETHQLAIAAGLQDDLTELMNLSPLELRSLIARSATGEPAAMHRIGRLHLQLRGNPPQQWGNPRGAHALWLSAAQSGFVPAMVDLGQLLATPYGVPQDRLAAVDWWTKAKSLGSADAVFHLAMDADGYYGGPRDEVRALSLWQQAALAGSYKAQGELCLRYSEGWRAPRNRHEARRWCALERRSLAGRPSVKYLPRWARGFSASDPISGIRFDVADDGRTVSAYSKDGRQLWSKDPFQEQDALSNSPSYGWDVRIDRIYPTTTYLGIGFGSSLGSLDALTGQYRFEGSD